MKQIIPRVNKSKRNGSIEDSKKEIWSASNERRRNDGWVFCPGTKILDFVCEFWDEKKEELKGMRFIEKKDKSLYFLNLYFCIKR